MSTYAICGCSLQVLVQTHSGDRRADCLSATMPFVCRPVYCSPCNRKESRPHKKHHMKTNIKNKRKPTLPMVRHRVSKRQGLQTENKRAQEDPITNGVLYIYKARDGLEKMRLDVLLQSKLKQKGKMMFEELPNGT